MSLDSIQSALESHLMELSGLPEIAWENVDFEPTVGEPFIMVNMQVQRERPATMGPGAQNYVEGLFILSIHAPINEGPQESNILSDTLKEHFNEQETLTSGGTVVRIRYSERKAPIVHKNWYIKNVVVSWYSFY